MGFLEQFIPPASKDAFAHKVMAALKKRKVKGPFVYDRGEFSLTAKGSGNVLYLGNAYAEYCAAPFAKRAKVIRLYAEMGSGGSNTLPGALRAEATRAKLLPRVRERFYGESLALTFKLKGLPAPEIPSLALNDDLVVNLIYDSPQSVSMVDAKTLSTWGMGFAEAMELARGNLWKISNENFAEIVPGLFMGVWKDSHAASRMFLHDLIWQLKVKGRHVVMVPNRDTLLVAGDEDGEALLRMAGLVQKAIEEPRFMTGSAFRLNETRWELFLPETDSVAYAALKAMHTQSLGQIYAGQKHFLEAVAAKAGMTNPAFVSTFSGMASQEGLVTSYAIWPQGAEGLLPDAEKYGMAGQAEGKPVLHGFVDAAAARAAWGELFEKTELYPVRWKVKGFPTAEQIAALGPTVTPGG